MRMIFTFFSMFAFLFIFNVTVARAVTVNPCECPDGGILKAGDVPAEECRALQEKCRGISDAVVTLPNPLGTPADTDISVLLGKIIKSVLGIIGSLALVMFIYGGATWMLSGGNQEQVTKGKNILIWAAAGIVIIFTAYALVRFVLTTVTGVNPIT